MCHPLKLAVSCPQGCNRIFNSFVMNKSAEISQGEYYNDNELISVHELQVAFDLVAQIVIVIPRGIASSCLPERGDSHQCGLTTTASSSEENR